MSKALLFVFVVKYILSVRADGLFEVFRWKQIDFYNRGDGGSNYLSVKSDAIIFPGPYNLRPKRDVITSRDQPLVTESRHNFDTKNNTSASYIAYNNVPMGVTHHKGRLFVTMPRRRVGIPSTLNYVDMRIDGNKESPKLHAYPNFATNQFNVSEGRNIRPNSLVSVYRTSVDACERLWFIDTGMLEYPGDRQQIQRPTIWIMDLRNDRNIRRFELPESLVETGRGLASITIDVQSRRCDQAFAYIPDLVYRRLYVYSFEANRAWSFSHNYFNFDPIAGDLNVGGQTFRWDDGIFSTTLGPQQPSGNRTVYFHPMASNNEFIVSNLVLQNESNAARDDHGNDFRLLGNRGTNKQSTMHVYDRRTGVIFYDEIHRDGVGCWNTNREFSAANHGTVARDAERMIYPSDLTIDDDGTIWVMTNSMPIFIYAELNTNIFNYRVWKQNVFEAKKNTICE